METHTLDDLDSLQINPNKWLQNNSSAESSSTLDGLIKLVMFMLCGNSELIYNIHICLFTIHLQLLVSLLDSQRIKNIAP